MSFISGLAFHKIAKWSYCPRYPVKIDPSQFEENDIVFLNMDCYDQFIEVLKNNPPKNKFILISHNTDDCFQAFHYERLKDMTTQIFAINSVCEHVHNIPIGFRDWPNDTMTIIKGINHTNIDKTTLVYMNFEIKTNILKRTECYNTFYSSGWVTKKQKVPITEYYDDIVRSKYIISPEGTGIDCHRIYEGLYFDAIPVLKTSRLDSFYRNLPVIIVQDWKEVTEEFLRSNYETFYNRLKQWKENNKDWLQPQSWICSI